LGCNFFESDYAREAALVEAAARGDEQRVREALCGNIDPNKLLKLNPCLFSIFGETAFLKISFMGKLKCMKLLLAMGADPDFASRFGTTPAMAAVEAKKPKRSSCCWTRAPTRTRPIWCAFKRFASIIIFIFACFNKPSFSQAHSFHYMCFFFDR